MLGQGILSAIFSGWASHISVIRTSNEGTSVFRWRLVKRFSSPFLESLLILDPYRLLPSLR